MVVGSIHFVKYAVAAKIIIKWECTTLLKQGQLSITMVCVVLGVMLAIQFRTTEGIRSTLPYQRAEDLTQRIMQVEKERDTLTEQLHSLRQSSGGETAETVRMGAGLVPLTGAGVIITVDDTKPAVPPSSKNPSLFLLKDEDLLKILNELRAAGAEAIAINNQRLVASSEIRTAGTLLSVNNTNISTPIEIKAIGHPATLENALKMRGGVIETLQFWGIQTTVKQTETVEIPAFKGTFHFQYAQPVGEK